jgi:hypothetical protein
MNVQKIKKKTKFALGVYMVSSGPINNLEVFGAVVLGSDSHMFHFL